MSPGGNLDELLATHDIRNTLYRYCRGVDRRDYGLVRSCYTASGIDRHGGYQGGIDGFISFLQTELPRFETTMHYVANVLVEVRGERAVAESYVTAFHRVKPTDDVPRHDFFLGLRYVDTLAKERGQGWLLADRTCVFEWSRRAEVTERSIVDMGTLRGAVWPSDPIYGALGTLGLSGPSAPAGS